MPKRYQPPADRSCLFREWIDGWAGETAVEPAGGEIIIPLQVVIELADIHPQIRLKDVGHRKAGVLMQLLGDRLPCGLWHCEPCARAEA